tara:strand:- start:327 stop:791 length:465 start_codon:yes stop_codon:yes gene_type:complete
MKYMIQDKYGKLMFTDGFHHIENKDVKKLKTFTEYSDASKKADKIGGTVTWWNNYIEEQGTKRKKQREELQKGREEALRNARVIDIPTRREWRLRDTDSYFDIMTFDWFVPIKTLLCESGYPIGVIGETPALESIFCYTYEELEIAEAAYEVVK